MTEIVWRKAPCDSGLCVEVGFVKSTHSIDSGNCVEVASPFRKASYSSDTANCVEVAGCHCSDVLVRDSKDPDGPRLSFDAISWTTFLAAIKAGEFG